MFKSLTIFAGVFAVSAAQAAIWTFNDPLQGSQEVPSNSSPATGTTFGTYDDVTNVLNITVTSTGFPTVVTAAHIHQAPPGVAGGVIFPLTGITGYNYYDANDTFNLTEAQEANLLAGLYYVNVHTVEIPAGEIRGQINPVPEPATLAALSIALAAALRRRNKLA